MNNYSNQQWLSDIYQQEFIALKAYAVNLVHNEQEAEEIVGNGFAILDGELIQNTGRFPSLAYAKAFLITTISHNCYAWLRKNCPADATAQVEAMAGDHHIVSEFRKYHLMQQLLPLIEHLPKCLQQETLSLLKEGLTIEQIEQRLHINKEAARGYRSGVISRLKEILISQKHALRIKRC